MFAKHILKSKYDENKNSKRGLCPRSDGSYRLRSEQEHVALSNVEALAWFEGGDGDGNTIGCPGGTCSMTDSFGRSCTACCPSGLKPKCDLSFGTCSCE